MAIDGCRYPSQPHRRKHGPRGYGNAIEFRGWLRDEFSFSCVYCLEREQWVNRIGHFHGDHFRPRSRTTPASSSNTTICSTFAKPATFGRDTSTFRTRFAFFCWAPSTLVATAAFEVARKRRSGSGSAHTRIRARYSDPGGIAVACDGAKAIPPAEPPSGQLARPGEPGPRLH
jgi:hypothetical protein